MKYKVTFYCPDKHILYDGGRQPDKKGVGGGVNARIRLAQALVTQGHVVDLICNCVRNEIHQGVRYIKLDDLKTIDTDVLIFTTSGDKLDLSPARLVDISSKLRIVLVHGTSMPGGLLEITPDVIYPLSNFVLKLIKEEWNGVEQKQFFISYRGVIKDYFLQKNIFYRFRKRDPYRLVYSGHPSKGREAALGILEFLREIDGRYNLYIFGDETLWGGRSTKNKFLRNVRNVGTIPQKKLAQELQLGSFGIFIQARLEPFGQTIIESMTAGCIPIASPVGAYQELIRHGENGFFVEGDPNDPIIWKKAADLIHELQQDPARLETIRKNAMRSTLDWQDVVLAWEQHWDIMLGNSDVEQYRVSQVCLTCSHKMIALADGLHCMTCGYFSVRPKSASLPEARSN